MALTVPYTDGELLQAVERTMEADGGRGEAYIRVLVTRGEGELTYNPAACPTPTLVIIVKAFPAPPERTFTKGIRVSLVGVRRNHPLALNPMIKSNNLLNNALAMQEALRNGGELVECSQSNFFVVREGEVRTPPLAAGLLPGITREFVLELADDLGIPARETTLRPEDLDTAAEAFITGTTREVTPVVAVDDVKIGDGSPGPITRRLLEEFRRRVA
jgi:branched-chain amino acid aminotransferase